MTTAANWFFNWLLAFITPYLEGTNYANLGSNVFCKSPLSLDANVTPR